MYDTLVQMKLRVLPKKSAKTHKIPKFRRTKLSSKNSTLLRCNAAANNRHGSGVYDKNDYI